MASLISSLKNIWDHWNIRLVILFSLFLQIVLILFAPSRKRTRGVLVLFVWLAYLLADWAASYCIGLITKNEAGKSTTTDNDFLMAFWGPFLLLHLGGPDTISAFALEDNELWLRHLFALIFQSATAAYVFFVTLPDNTLWFPTSLMFIAGLIKYVERIHALYVAAVSNFRKSLLPRPDAGPNYAKLMEEHFSRQEVGLPTKIIMISELHQQLAEAAKSDAEGKKDDKSPAEQKEDYHIKLVQKAFFFFQKFQGLIADMIYSFKDRRDSQKFFEEKTAEEALLLIEVELNFMYEVFYSKASVVRQHSFWLLGKFVSLVSIIASIVLFLKAKRNGFDPSDVTVTYVLLYGALVLDVMALVMRFFTDYTATLSDESLIDSYTASFYQRLQITLFKVLNKRFLERYLRLRKPTWSKIKEGPYKDSEKLSTNFLFRRWCGLMSGHNLLKYCLDESIPRVPNNLHPSFNILKDIQKWCFEIVLFVQDLFYQRNKRSSRFKDLVDQLRYKSKNPFLKELWEYVFDELKKKSAKAKDIEDIQSICSARGEQVIQKVKFESLKPGVNPREVAEQLRSLKWYVKSKEVEEQNEKSKSNVDPNKVTTQSKSSRPNVDYKEVSALFKKLKPYLDTNGVPTQSESSRPNVDYKEVSALFKKLKPYLDTNGVTTQSESSRPNVDSDQVSTLLTSLKSDVDSIIVATQSERLKPFVDHNDVTFDQSLLLWHIATALCYAKDARVEGDKRGIVGQEKKDMRRKISMLLQEIRNKILLLWQIVTALCYAKDTKDEGDRTKIDGEEKEDKKDKKMKISMLLSDYMLYLLVMQPNLMSVITGIGQIRFQDTCEEAKKFLRKRITPLGDREAMLKEACDILMKVPTEEKPIDVKGDRSKSLLFEACRLFKDLDKLPNEDKKWEIISCVWVELLSYAACHCRPTGHVQLLSKGGELISFVWLLMVQLGLSTQFQIKDGDARAKLIVGNIKRFEEEENLE